MNTSFCKKILSLFFFISNGFSGCNISSVAPVEEPEVIKINDDKRLKLEKVRSLRSIAREIKKGGQLPPLK